MKNKKKSRAFLSAVTALSLLAVSMPAVSVNAVDDAVKSAAGQHAVADFQRGKHGAHLLLFFLLGPVQDKIEKCPENDHIHQNHREYASRACRFCQ